MDKPKLRKKAARREMRDMVKDLRHFRLRLLGFLSLLPARDDERARTVDMNDDYDATTEKRLVGQCVLHEQIDSAILSLRDAARYKPERKGKKAKRGKRKK
jgi:hypothetical protein